MSDSYCRANKRVLIFEDEPITALDEKRIIEKLGYEVTSIAATVDEALRRVEDAPPDLVLMDIRLRDAHRDGVDAAMQIRQRHSIPVVFAAAYATDSIMERVSETLPYGFLLKPFGEKQMRSTLEVAFARPQAEVKLKERERRLRVLIEQGREIIIVVDRGGFVRYASPSVQRELGYDSDDHVGRNTGDFLRPPLRARATRLLQHLAEHGGRMPVSFSFDTADGKALLLEGTFTDLTSESGIEGYVLNLHDVTQRRVLEIEDVALNLHDVTQRRVAERQRGRRVGELTRALQQMKTLEGLLPVYSDCREEHWPA